MALKQYLIGLSLIFILSNCKNHTEYNFDSKILDINYFDKKCPILPERNINISNLDSIELYKQEVVSISNCDSNINNYFIEKQIGSTLNYNGKFIHNDYPIMYFFSLIGHSGKSVGKNELFLIAEFRGKLCEIKISSTQVDSPYSLRYKFLDNYLMLTKSYNENYDLPNNTIESVTYNFIILKINDREIRALTKIESERVFRDIFMENFQ